MTGPHLIYVADPMCSWCWGFSPVIAAIRQRFGASLPIRLIVGGLRPGTTKPLDEDAKATIREHWEHVHEASGQPFDFGFFARAGFVYDTEPASRAVVVVRRQGSMGATLDYLAAAHRAFYAENQDVTDPDVLADLAASLGHGREAFVEEFASEEARQETALDFAIAQQAGIRGFPTLLAGPQEGGGFGIVAHGFQPTERILPTVQAWLDRQPVGTSA